MHCMLLEGEPPPPAALQAAARRWLVRVRLEREYVHQYVGCHSRHEGANVRLWEELLLPVLESHTASP